MNEFANRSAKKTSDILDRIEETLFPGELEIEGTGYDRGLFDRRLEKYLDQHFDEYIDEFYEADIIVNINYEYDGAPMDQGKGEPVTTPIGKAQSVLDIYRPVGMVRNGEFIPIDYELVDHKMGVQYFIIEKNHGLTFLADLEESQ